MFLDHGRLVVAPLPLLIFSYSILQSPKILRIAHPFQLYLCSHLCFCCDGYPIASSMSTSSPKEASTPATVKTVTRTDAIIEEKDLMQHLLGKNAGHLDRDQEVGRDDDSEGPYLVQMVEIMQEGNWRVQQELEHNSRTLRCFEKTIEKAIHAQTDSLNQLNDTIGNLLLPESKCQGRGTPKRSRRDPKKKTRPRKQAPL